MLSLKDCPTESEKTSVPATKALPSSTASMVISSRPLWASTLRSAVRYTVPAPSAGAAGGVEAPHPVEDAVGGRAVHLVDDPAVGEEDHPVRVGGGHRV